jgi:hypothetical protein
MKTSTAVVLFLLIGGTAGCGSSPPTTPGNPPPPPTPRTPVIAEFRDPASTFTTRDVRDVDDQIVQFDTANNALIWVADGRSFPGYPVSGNLISSGGFQVRFGTKNGECRAYFTETGPATICDINVVNGQLVILPTSVAVQGGCS